jgi:hypothetical protein
MSVALSLTVIVTKTNFLPELRRLRSGVGVSGQSLGHISRLGPILQHHHDRGAAS